MNLSPVTTLNKLVRNIKNAEHDPLRPMIDAYLLERDHAPQRYKEEDLDLNPRLRPPGRFSPSNLGGCEREAAYRFVGARSKKMFDPDLQLIFDDGEWRHLKWQATFRDMEKVLGPKRFKVIAIEQRVQYKDLFIEGSLDAILRIIGELIVVDIKGISEQGFQFVMRNNKPIAKHVLQLISYMRARKIRRGLIWYENKNNQYTLAFIIEFNNEDWAEVQAWTESVISFLEKKKLPPAHPDCRRGTIGFQKCPYADLCFGSMDIQDVEAKVYRNFISLEDQWEKGQQALVSGTR